MGLDEAARTALNQCIQLKDGESVVIVTDNKREEIADVLYKEAEDITDDVVKLTYPPRDRHGQEPPEGVHSIMEMKDVFLAPTTKSITHTRAVSKAVESGSRGSTLPAITKDAFELGLSADYDQVRENCESLYEQVKEASTVRFVTDKGTDLAFEPRDWYLDTGEVSQSGTYANLPSGEIFTAPESVSGTIVYDGSIRPHGKLSHDIEVEVEDGYVTDISDDELRMMIESAEEEAGEAARNLAETAIGANPAVSDLTGNILLDEKAAETVHIAIGDNINFGGEVEAPIHEDGVVRNPTVYADGEEVELPNSRS